MWNRQNRVASLAALAIVLTGCAGGTESASTPLETDTTTPSASEITVGTLPAGDYSSQLLGTEVGVQLDTEWHVPVASTGAIALEWTDQPVPFTRAVLMLRGIDYFWSPEPVPNTLVGFPLWVAENEIDVVEDDGRVDGAITIILDLKTRLDEPVPLAYSEALGGLVELKPGEVVRVWIIEQAELDPIVMMAFVTEDDTDWLAEADALVDGITLGEVAQSPILGGPATPADGGGAGGGGEVPLSAAGFHNQEDFPLGLLAFDLFGGVEISAPAPGIVLATLPDGRHDLAFVAPTQTEDGTPLTDVASLLAAIPESESLVEAGTYVVMGREATGYIDLVPQALGQGLSVAPPGEASDASSLLLPRESHLDIPIDVDGRLLIISARTDDEGCCPGPAEDVLLLTLQSVGIG